MKKKLLCLMLIFAMTMSGSAVFAYGNVDSGEKETVSPYSTFGVTFGTKRFSDTKAAASVSVRFTDYADNYEVIITLQKKSGSSWITATDVAKNTIKYIGTNNNRVLTYDEWTVKKGALYRIKCTSTDKYDGIKYTHTNYSDPF